MNQIKIFSTTDENYAQHLTVMMASALANNTSDTPVCFYIIDSGLSEYSKAKFNALEDRFRTMPRKYGKDDWRTLGLAVLSLEVALYPDGILDLLVPKIKTKLIKLKKIFHHA